MCLDDSDVLRHNGKVTTHKAMTIRLDPTLAESLETVASVDEQPVSDVIRAAITEHIAKRQNDAEFREGLQARIERAQKLLQ